MSSTVFVLLVVVRRRWFSSSFEDRARDRERRSRWPEEERNARARGFSRLKSGKKARGLDDGIANVGGKRSVARFGNDVWTFPRAMVALCRAMRVGVSELGRVRALSGRRFRCVIFFFLSSSVFETC